MILVIQRLRMPDPRSEWEAAANGRGRGTTARAAMGIGSLVQSASLVQEASGSP
jgi:hypothetical protein